MPRGYRGAIFAIVGFLVGGLGLGTLIAWALWPGSFSLPSYGWQETSYSDYQPGGESCEPPAISRLPTDSERTSKREACEEVAEQHRIDTNDLKQQTRAADAATAAAIIAEWQAKATVFGLIVGFYTLSAAAAAAFFAKQAADETKRGANAAEQAVAEARRIGEAQTRAYLSISSLAVRVTEEGLEFRAIIQNSGQSPALSAMIMLEIVDREGTKHRVLPEHEQQVPAQSSAEMSYCYFIHPTVHQWGSIIVIATVAYGDVFERVDKVEDRFADLTAEWNRDEFTELTKAMHVASYLRASGEQGDGIENDDSHHREA